MGLIEGPARAQLKDVAQIEVPAGFTKAFLHDRHFGQEFQTTKTPGSFLPEVFIPTLPSKTADQ